MSSQQNSPSLLGAHRGEKIQKRFREISSEDPMSTQPGPASPTTTTNTLDFEPYVDAAVAAQFLHLAINTVNAGARTGKIPAHAWGDGARKTWRFKLSEL